MAQNNKYMTWQLIAPPATRFYQMVDGNFAMYFERAKIAEMIEWADKQAEAFRRLGEFIKQQVVDEENAAVAAAQKAEERQTIAAGVNPFAKHGGGFVPNLKTAEAQTKIAAMNPVRVKGVKPPKQVIAGQTVTTLEEVVKAVPIAPVTPPKPDLSLDPGMRIAMQQSKLVDAVKGIDREAKNNAPDEEIEVEVEETEEVTEPSIQETQEKEEDIPETERPTGETTHKTQPAPVDDSPY